ncbi:MAG: glycosyltransferase [Pseudomonadota bacterium]
MKILFYNWCQFDDPGMAGGGVSLYLNTIIDALSQREGVDVYFLSSGRHYGLFRRRPQIIECGNVFGDRGVRTFKIWNSPIKAPAHDAFSSVGQWMRDRKSVDLVRGFVADHGPFDVFHIHNLEGVSANILSLEKSENVRSLYYTFHNYMPLCPQIELLYKGHSPCENYFNGKRCVSCVVRQQSMQDLIFYSRLGGWLSGRGLSGHPLGNYLFGAADGFKKFMMAHRYLASDVIRGFRTGWGGWRAKSVSNAPTTWAIDAAQTASAPHGTVISSESEPGVLYKQWREANGAALARNFDGVFAVSTLAQETAQKFLPVGTRVEAWPLPMDLAGGENAVPERAPAGQDVTISFLGYDIPSKGLRFLLRAFEGIDDPYYRDHVHLKIVSRLSNTRDISHLDQVFKSVRVVNGYKRNELVGLASTIDLNIVPSIWPETYNQVATELARLGVPSLLSDRVGAQEILPDKTDFVFKANNQNDFRTKLDRLVKDAQLRHAFFRTPLNIPTVADHVDRLLHRFETGIAK